MLLKNTKKFLMILSALILTLSFFAPMTSANSIASLNDEEIVELNIKASKGVLASNLELKKKIEGLKSSGYEVDVDSVYEHADGGYFVSFEKENIKGLIEFTQDMHIVFYAELNESYDVMKLTIEKADGEIAIVEYDETGTPIVLDQDSLNFNSGIMMVGNVCDWGLLGLGTIAGAGYGAVFGGFVGAAVGGGIGALGAIYC